MLDTTLRGLLAGILLIAPATTAAADPLVPIRSGLDWASGVTTDAGEAFESWRGRPLDVTTVYFGKETWRHILASARGRNDATMPVAIGFPMLPKSHRGQLAPCADGAFDADIRDIRDAMLENGWQSALIRLGWEGNRMGSFAWAVDGDGTDWKRCFRRWVDILNPVVEPGTAPTTRTRNFVIVWNMGNRGTFPYPIEQMWPGEEYVDIVASQYYDRCPPLAAGDAAGWERLLDDRDDYGNPAGPRAWLEFAKSKGKRWALAEWGVGGSQQVCRRPGIDNPFLMLQMFEFLSENAEHVAFEAYFNNDGHHDGTHAIYPTDVNPLSAAVYRELWGSP
jgi:hypothetical protein